MTGDTVFFSRFSPKDARTAGKEEERLQTNDFARVITLIRKEKGISQKQAAAELGVSQALLSHYEKGVRECGLDFVLRVADYYDVSCDYLLGRSADRLGTTIKVDEIPEEEGGDKALRGSVLPTLNKKLIVNSLNVIFDILAECDNKTLVVEMSDYIMDVVYKAFRYIYSANAGNTAAMFKLNEEIFPELIAADMLIRETKIKACLGKAHVEGVTTAEKAKELKLSPEKISKNWPSLSGSLLNLIKTVENEQEVK